MWDKLDEVMLGLIGASILGFLGYTAISCGFDGGVAQACIIGITAIITGALGMKAGRSEKEKEVK
jgi:hypothetical protein